MNKVDFMCVGAPKCGTTWLYQMLNQHPQVFIPKEKELHYFNTLHPETHAQNPHYGKDISWYHAFFKNATLTQKKGDFSTSYLQDIDIASKLYQYNASVKIIMVLRNPIERAWSHFRFLYSRGMIQNDNFMEGIKTNKSILTAGLYASPCLALLNKFGSDQVHIILFEELGHPNKLIKAVFKFLDLADFLPENIDIKVNTTKTIKNNMMHRTVTRIKHSSIKEVIQKLKLGGILNNFYSLNSTQSSGENIPKEIYDFLKKYYHDDLYRLSQIISRNIINWR